MTTATTPTTATSTTTQNHKHEPQPQLRPQQRMVNPRYPKAFQTSEAPSLPRPFEELQLLAGLVSRALGNSGFCVTWPLANWEPLAAVKCSVLLCLTMYLQRTPGCRTSISTAKLRDPLRPPGFGWTLLRRRLPPWASTVLGKGLREIAAATFGVWANLPPGGQDVRVHIFGSLALRGSALAC